MRIVCNSIYCIINIITPSQGHVFLFHDSDNRFSIVHSLSGPVFCAPPCIQSFYEYLNTMLYWGLCIKLLAMRYSKPFYNVETLQHNTFVP